MWHRRTRQYARQSELDNCARRLLARGQSVVQSVSNLLTKLNLATRRWHADVDDPWLELMRPDVAQTDYLAQLVRMYGLVAPFESACLYTRGVTKLLEYRQLLRAGLIAQDILALGLSPNQVSRIPTCPAITMFRDIGEAL